MSTKGNAQSPVVLMDTEGRQKKKKKNYLNYNEKTQSISEGNSGIYSK